LASLNKHFRGAALDDELFELIQKPSVRARLRRVLIETHFSAPAQELVYDQGRINKEAYHYGRQLIESVTEGAPTSTRQVEGQVREKGFRQAVAVYAYQHQCAFCDIKICTPNNYSVIEAAHIVPWSVSQDDDPRNGLGLCRLCHWIFDNGLITVSIDYKLIFSYALRISDNILKHIDQLEGTFITLPCDEVLNPDVEKLKWHHKKKFIKE
jgi:putative restriction endonuclease